MSYYVPIKNRCQDCENSSGAPIQLLFTYNSSKHIEKKGSQVVYFTENEQEQNAVEKGIGNVKKHGSGGTSYHTFLSKKKGIVYCDCNENKLG